MTQYRAIVPDFQNGLSHSKTCLNRVTLGYCDSFWPFSRVSLKAIISVQAGPSTRKPLGPESIEKNPVENPGQNPGENPIDFHQDFLLLNWAPGLR